MLEEPIGLHIGYPPFAAAPASVGQENCELGSLCTATSSNWMGIIRTGANCPVGVLTARITVVFELLTNEQVNATPVSVTHPHPALQMINTDCACT